MIIAKNILKFIEVLKYQTPKVPDSFEIINPFIEKNKNKINKIVNIFYNKYYNDNNLRYIILSSSPARQGTAITGIPFESIKHLEKETGILIDEKG